MDPDQTVWMRRLVWIHAGRKPIMLVLSWHGSIIWKILLYHHAIFAPTGITLHFYDKYSLVEYISV
jgi:hypothetical protein